MSSSSCYLYGVCPAPGPHVESLTTTLGGVNQPVQLIEESDLVMVWSALEEDIPTLRASRKNLMAHQKVLEEILKTHTLLPLRFGTIAENEDQVRRLLARNQEAMQQQLQRVEGKFEMGLKAIWKDMQVIFQELVADNQTIQKRKQQAQKGGLSHDQQIELGKQVEQALQNKRELEAQALLQRLQPLALEYSQQDPIGDSMCLNAAFLIDRAHEAAFDERVQQIGDDYENRMDFKYVGPLPPYNFVTLDLQWEEQPQS